MGLYKPVVTTGHPLFLIFLEENAMYTMKDVCRQVHMPYETLKYYCNEGLIPNVKRDGNNYRVFDDRDVAWIQSLSCLKQCGMGIAEMKEYVQLCLQGEASIPARKAILARKRERLTEQLRLLHESIDYIDKKQAFYADVQAGRVAYTSNLVDTGKH